MMQSKSATAQGNCRVSMIQHCVVCKGAHDRSRVEVCHAAQQRSNMALGRVSRSGKATAPVGGHQLRQLASARMQSWLSHPPPQSSSLPDRRAALTAVQVQCKQQTCFHLLQCLQLVCVGSLKAPAGRAAAGVYRLGWSWPDAARIVANLTSARTRHILDPLAQAVCWLSSYQHAAAEHSSMLHAPHTVRAGGVSWARAA